MPEPGWGVDAHGRAYRLDGLVVCDFCLGPGPTWEFPAAPMPIVGHATIGASDDEWAACDECAALVTASRLGELVERCVQRQRELYPTGTPGPGGTIVQHKPLPLARRDFRANLLRFLDARTGPPRPFSNA
jgi:hypothetical protein